MQMEKQTKLSTSQNTENKNDDTYLKQACIHLFLKKLEFVESIKERNNNSGHISLCNGGRHKKEQHKDI